MQYWQFRLTVYQRHLEAWLNTIKQAAAGVVYLFPMAMPALLMLPLLALGVMADSATSTQQYCLALWGFLLLTHSWVTLQKDGILATPYEHYHNGLPLSTVQRKVTTALLTVYASHVFVVGPILLFFIMAICSALCAKCFFLEEKTEERRGKKEQRRQKREEEREKRR